MTGMLASLKSMWVLLAGVFAGALVFLRSTFMFKLRIRGRYAMRLLEILEARGWVWKTSEEFADGILPAEYKAWCFLDGMFFHFTVAERMMKAGMSGTDSVASVTIGRSGLRKMKALLAMPPVDDGTIGVYILQSWDAMKIGQIPRQKGFGTLFMRPAAYEELDREFQAVAMGEKDKTGVFLHGAQGNGKTYALRHFAQKYRMSLYIVALQRDLDNISLIRMFSKMEGPAIVLFEDFHAYFDKRQPLLERPNFTFDVILNVIDGVYSQPKGIVFAMTANDIDKVDVTLRCRPGRFRVVREIASPDALVRSMVFGHYGVSNVGLEELVADTKGMTLDMVIFVAQRIAEGQHSGVALSEVEQHFAKDSDGIPIWLKKEEEKLPKVDAAV